MRRLTTLGLLVAAATAVTAQAPAPAGAPASAPPAAEAVDVSAGVPLSHGFTYNAEGRRDPFVSMMRRGSEVVEHGRVRPSGLAGLGVSEVTLRGTLASHGGHVAIVHGADSKTYIVRAGDKLMDGTIRAITADTMVILQQVDDPLSRETEREVRKILRQTEAAHQ